MCGAIIWEDTITFPKGMYKSNGGFIELPLDQFITSHGFIVPIANSPFDIIDCLENTIPKGAKAPDGWKAMILDASGCLREYYCEKGESTYARLVYGKGVKFCRANAISVEETFYAAIKLAKSPKHAIEISAKCADVRPSLFVTLSISDMLKMLKGR